MHKTVKLAALLAGLATAVLGVTPAAAATVHPAFGPEPICLISIGHHPSHSTTCVRLNRSLFGDTAWGSLRPGDHDPHTVTVTLQVERPFHHGWDTVAGQTEHGVGPLVAVTHPVHVPGFVRTRACVDVDNGPTPLCTP